MENAQGRFKIDFIIFVTSVQLVLPKNNVYTGLCTFNAMSLEKRLPLVVHVIFTQTCLIKTRHSGVLKNSFDWVCEFQNQLH